MAPRRPRPPARRAVAHFALPAVRGARLGEPYGDPPESFDTRQHLRDAFGAFAGGTVETVRLHVAPGAAASFRRKAYHPTQIVEEEHSDGALTVSFEAAAAPDLAAFVRSFGPAVRVLAPPALADAVASGITPGIIEMIVRGYLMIRHHAIAATANAGKVALYQGNPLAINQAVWMALVRYLVPHTKYLLFDKHRLRLEHMDRINEAAWNDILSSGGELLERAANRHLALLEVGRA